MSTAGLFAAPGPADSDPQVYSRQVKTRRAAGVLVAASNAAAARLAAQALVRHRRSVFHAHADHD